MRQITGMGFFLALYIVLAGNATAATPVENPLFQEAQKLESDGHIDEAIAIYERLYHDDGNDLYFWKLISLYEQVGRWDDLESFARQKLASQPENIEVSRYLAHALYGRGDHDAAKKTLLSIIDNRWDEKALVQFVAAEFQSYGEYREAVNVFLEARKRLDEPVAFAPELGLLYQYQESYLDAIREYARVLDSYSAAYLHSVELINEAHDDGVDLKQMAAPFRDYLTEHPESINAGRLVSAILVEAGDFAEAYRLFRIPTVATGSYADLWQFIERIEEEGEAGLAVIAYDDFVKSFPDNASVILARMRAADLLAGMGENREAERRYRMIIGDYAGTYEAAAATLSLIELSHNGSDFDSFSGLLAEFAETTGFREVSCRAYRMLGDAFLKHGDADEAKNAYTKAKLNAESRNDRYEISIRLAVHAFYTGAYEQMAPEIQQAIAVLPEGAEINDLLAERILYMRCVTDHDREQYAVYASGKYAVYSEEKEEAIQAFTEVAEDTSTVIAPSASVALADLYRNNSQTDKAIEWYLHAAEIAEDTTLHVGAMLEAAKLAETLPDGLSQARELYVKALSDHPGTVHDAELRTRLQAVIER